MGLLSAWTVGGIVFIVRHLKVDGFPMKLNILIFKKRRSPSRGAPYNQLPLFLSGGFVVLRHEISNGDVLSDSGVLPQGNLDRVSPTLREFVQNLCADFRCHCVNCHVALRSQYS